MPLFIKKKLTHTQGDLYEAENKLNHKKQLLTFQDSFLGQVVRIPIFTHKNPVHKKNLNVYGRHVPIMYLHDLKVLFFM